MADPTTKSRGIRNLLNNLAGVDTEARIRADWCVPRPLGCGGPATEFEDDLSRREYRISGLCQKCQDSVFGR